MTSVLSKPDLKRYLRKKPALLESMLNEREQVNPNGIDLSVRDVQGFEEYGMLGFTSKKRRLPKMARLEWRSGRLHLAQGCYKITYNEIIHMPLDLVAIARPRSSLLRCGASVETAVWDPGYNGRSESLLVVHNPLGLELCRNARVVQLLFLKNTKRPRKGYSGIYTGENI